MRRAVGAEAVDAIQVEGRRAEVLQPQRIPLLVGRRRQVEGNVVVDELAEIGEAGGNVVVPERAVVGIGIEHRRRPRLQLAVGNIERRQMREHAPEPAGENRESKRLNSSHYCATSMLYSD